MDKAKCANCAAAIPPNVASGRPRSYCSSQCRRATEVTLRAEGRWRVRAKGQEQPAALALQVSAVICTKCGRLFRVVRAGRWRSECYHCKPSLLRELPILHKRCPVCRDEFATAISNQVYCGSRCSKRQHKRRRSVARPLSESCLYCGQALTQTLDKPGAKKNYCSYACKEDANTLFRRHGFSKEILVALWQSPEGKAILESLRQSRAKAHIGKTIAGLIRKRRKGESVNEGILSQMLK